MKTGVYFHKDSFGRLQTALQGVTTWTLRQIRSTKIVVPHIAKGDVFTYKCQINHDKVLDTPLDGFHIHMIPIGAVEAGDVVSIDFEWGWLTNGDTMPATLPNADNVVIQISEGTQFQYMIRQIVTNLTPPTGEEYSSEFFIACTRRNDATDTYDGEFALLDGDVHYLSNHLGSYSEYNDSTVV